MQANTQKKLRFFLIAFFLEGILFATILILLPRDKSSGFLLGYSLPRLIMLGTTIFISMGFAGIYLFPKIFSHVHTASIQQQPIIILGLMPPFAVSTFLLSHWLFINPSTHLVVYLERLTPLSVYIEIIAIQAAYFFISTSTKKQLNKIFPLLIMGIPVLLSILFTIEYTLSNSFFTFNYLAQPYTKTLRLILLTFTLLTIYILFLYKVLQNKLRLQLNYTWGVVIIFLILGYLYYDAAIQYASTNNASVMHSDQLAYIKFSKKVYETNFSFTGNRNRMPIYPFLQALFYHPAMDDYSFFTEGIQRNIILSLLCSLVFFFIARQYLSYRRATIITLIVAFGVFIFRSPHFTSEVLYYFLSFISFLGMGKMLIKPTFKLGLATGIFLALTYLTKASNLPAIAAFIFVFIVKEIVKFLQKNKKKKYSLQPIVILTTTLLIFLLLIFPYLQESKRKYGHYFYNVNTTFYIWHDTYYEAVHDKNLAGHLEHWPNTPENQLPSLHKYVQEHTFSQAIERLSTGMKAQIGYLANPDTKINYLFIYGGTLLFLTATLGRKKRRKIIAEHWAITLFFATILFGYIFLYSWYYPIGSGGRFIYSIFIPVMFFLFVATDTIIKNSKSKSKILGIPAFHFFESIVFTMLLFNIYYVITIALPSGYFGS